MSWPKRDGSPSFLKHLGPFGCIETAILNENAKSWKSRFHHFFRSRISTDQTVQKYWVFRIFHTPLYVQGVWKILKTQYFCTVWSVEILDFCFSFLAGRDFFFEKIEKNRNKFNSTSYRSHNDRIFFTWYINHGRPKNYSKIPGLPQTKPCKNIEFLEFSRDPGYTRVSGKF